MIRAATVDLVVETGVDYLRAFALYRPDDAPTRADALVPGDRMYLDGLPEYVYAVKSEPSGAMPGVALTFRQGLWWQPKLWLPSDEMVMKAEPVTMTSARAAWTDPFQKHKLTTWTTEDGTVVVLGLSHHETMALAPYVGTWPWDLFVTTLELGSLRLAAGSLSILIGEASGPYSASGADAVRVG